MSFAKEAAEGHHTVGAVTDSAYTTDTLRATFLHTETTSYGNAKTYTPFVLGGGGVMPA